MTVLYGPDISHYQSGINLRNVAAENLSFVIGKVSQGSTSYDTQWAATRDQGRAAGLVVIGYAYVTTDDPSAQAANCAAHIGDMTIPVALDWETGGGNWANLLAVLTAFRTAGLNVRLLYTGQWWWAEQGSPDMTGCGLALWKSRYPSTNPGAPTTLYANVPASYWAPLGGLPTSLLQFSDRASIAGMATDCSAFQGTRDDLLALLGMTGGTGELTPEEHQMLVDLHDRVCRLETAWAGGVTDAQNTPYDMRLLVNRVDVEVHQARADIAALRTYIAQTLLAAGS